MIKTSRTRTTTTPTTSTSPRPLAAPALASVTGGKCTPDKLEAAGENIR